MGRGYRLGCQELMYKTHDKNNNKMSETNIRLVHLSNTYPESNCTKHTNQDTFNIIRKQQS